MGEPEAFKTYPGALSAYSKLLLSLGGAPASMLLRHETFALAYHFIFKQKLFYLKENEV